MLICQTYKHDDSKSIIYEFIDKFRDTPDNIIIRLEVFKSGTTLMQTSLLSEGDRGTQYYAAVDSMLSMLVALASEKFDMNNTKIIRAIETALDTISNEYGD